MSASVTPHSRQNARRKDGGGWLASAGQTRGERFRAGKEGARWSQGGELLGRNVRVEMEGRSDASRRRAKEKILPVESAPRLEGVEGSGNWEGSGSQRRGW